MAPELKVLNDLCSILEALVQDLTGESKSELSQLISNLRTNPAYAIVDRNRIASEIYEAREDVRERRIVECGIKLSSICRQLWAIVDSRA
jgi:hypothetical protein